MDSIGNLVLGVYRAARELSIPEFRAAALSEIRRAVHFDSAMWGVGEVHATAGFVIERGHIANQQEGMLVSGAAVKGHVFGATVHSITHEIQHLLVIASQDKVTAARGFISLRRVSARDRYSDDERLLTESLLPHFFEARTINRLLWIDRSSAPDGGGQRDGAAIFPLTRGERAVAAEIARGLSYKAAARALGISPSTVRNQLHTAYAKLGVNNKVALARRLNDGVGR